MDGPTKRDYIVQTPQSMKDRCIETVETFRGLRIKVGPSSKSLMLDRKDARQGELDLAQ